MTEIFFMLLCLALICLINFVVVNTIIHIGIHNQTQDRSMFWCMVCTAVSLVLGAACVTYSFIQIYANVQNIPQVNENVISSN